MANVATIQAELDLDSGRFTGQIASAVGSLKSFNAAVNTSDKSIKHMESRITGLGSSLRDTMVILGQFRAALHTIWAFTGQWVYAIIDANAKLEKMQVLMTGLSRASTQVGKVNDALRDMNWVLDKAKKAPFAVDEIANAFVKLKASGIDPTKGSMDALMNAIANFGGGDQEFHRATIAIQQMAGKGVISMEELRQQLGEAVPNAMALMARATGLTMAQLTKTIASGRLAAGPALASLFKEMEMQYSGSAERMMNTWTGMVSRLKTQWLQFAQEIGKQGAFDAAKAALRDLITFMSSPAGATFARDIGQALKTGIELAAKFGKWLIDNRAEIITWGKILAQVFVAKKVAEFGVGLISAAANIKTMVTTLGGLTTAMAGARAGTLGLSAAIGAAAGPVGIAVAAITVLIGYIRAQKAMAEAGAQAMSDYWEKTKNGVAVDPEEHKAMLARLDYLGRVKKLQDDYKNVNQPGIAAWGNAKRLQKAKDDAQALMTEGRELGFVKAGTKIGDKYDMFGQQLDYLNTNVIPVWEEHSKSTMRQAGLQIGATIDKQVEGWGAKLDTAVDRTAPKMGSKLDDLWKEFDGGKMQQPEYIAKRQKLMDSVTDAKIAAVERVRAKQADVLERVKGDAKATAAITKIMEVTDAKLQGLRDEKVANADPTQGIKLLPKMGGDGDAKAKQDPRVQYLETLRGKIAALTATIEEGDPTLAKFDATLGKGDKSALANTIRGEIAVLTEKKELVEKIKATEKMTQDLGDMKAKSEADVVSARIEATGEMYSQVSAGMVGFNRQVAVLGANLSKTKMDRDEFNKWVADIQKNVAEVDFINLNKFVKNAEWESYLNSLPKRERDLALFNRRLAENTSMIDQMKLNDPNKSASRTAEYDTLGAINAKSISQQYANDTKPAWKSLIEEWQDVTTEMDQVWANSMQSISNSLFEAVTTGKLAFKDLCTSILKEITRVLVSKAVASLVTFVISTFGGQAMSSTPSSATSQGGYSGGSVGGSTSTGAQMYGGNTLQHYAKGGVFTNKTFSKPTTFKFANGAAFGEMGEAGPEAVMPLKKDGAGRLGVSMVGGMGGAGGINNQVQIAITINQDGSAKSESGGTSEQARALGTMIDGRVKETLTAESRPGGILWQMKHG